MSKSDRYFKAPLSILRRGASALDALEACLCCGIVNAGIGYRESREEVEFEALLEDAASGLPVSPPKDLQLVGSDGKPMARNEAVETWRAAQAGAKLLDITGGSRASDAQTWATNYRRGEVFFTIRSDWLWNAIYTAREQDGLQVGRDFKPLSWREFRILAAILSAPVNKSRGFVFLGWESIQARACGFHNKALMAANNKALPSHCEVLSRSKIDLTTSKLEKFGFFLRFRYSKGARGGKTAYSFRHESREKLAEEVQRYQDEHCLQATLKSYRTMDRELCLRMAASPHASSKSPAT